MSIMYSQVLNNKIDKVFIVKEIETMFQLMYKETISSYIKQKILKNFINRSKKQEKFIIMKMTHNSIKKSGSIIC
jgi:hypothetical protein